MGHKELCLTAFERRAPINQWAPAPLIYLFPTVHLHFLQLSSVRRVFG